MMFFRAQFSPGWEELMGAMGAWMIPQNLQGQQEQLPHVASFLSPQQVAPTMNMHTHAAATAGEGALHFCSSNTMATRQAPKYPQPFDV